ncbi:MAG TPA: DUF262 domain-containing protein [Parafilimonas sp.]|nr:DUF262 domain-containing protein [Parafilimonas sp.]
MDNQQSAKQEIKKLAELLKMENLMIPDYQRPYKWKAENVTQLLDDIFEYAKKDKIYRIGSLILHKKNDKYNIVDGQQRLTTISILLHCLKEVNTLLLDQNYKHKVSKDNIVYNFQVIKNWLNNKSNDTRNDFKERLLEKCEFVIFTVYEEDEAFQLFDSQNSRGKALEPFDLLKAFHLREMDLNKDSENEKERTVEIWEKAIDNGTLKPILGNHLFKIRNWVKNGREYDFNKDHIHEFKGISMYQAQQYPYESSLRILDGFVENAQKDKLLRNDHISESYPYSITMPIINGKRFFEYVDYFIQQKENLFGKQDGEFYKFYVKYVTNYKKAWRDGDLKVRNLYENILLLYKNKFGEQEFEEMYPSFYKAVYSIRCNKKSIGSQTILNSDERKILQEISYSMYPEKLKKYRYKNYLITKTDLANEVGFIKDAINNNFNENNE